MTRVTIRRSQESAQSKSGSATGDFSETMDANARGTLGTQRGELVEPLESALQTLPQCPTQKDELCTIYAEAIFLVLISIAILSYIDRQFRAQNFLEFLAALRGLLSISERTCFRKSCCDYGLNIRLLIWDCDSTCIGHHLPT